MRRHALTVSVALLALLLPAGGALVARAAPPAPAAGFHAVIAVEATYPGATAQVVADTVAAPIEQQVNGLDHLAHMVSRCTDDGRYTLLLGFDSAVDLDVHQVLVENRVALAMPQLPAAVQNAGVHILKVSPGVLLVVVLTSPDGRFDAGYLGGYPALQIKDELARLPGVANVALLGAGDFGVRVVLDSEKLAAVKLTSADVLKALREQDLREKTKPVGQPPAKAGETFQLALERPADPESLADVILKAVPGCGTVRLKDVGRVELGGAPSGGAAVFDGRPAVALAVTPLSAAKPRDVNVAVRERMEGLRKAFLDGVDYNVAVDLAAPPAPLSCLLAEPVLPAAASAKRVLECRTRYAELLAKTEGVRHVLSLPDDPFTLFHGGPCVAAVFDKDMKEADWQKSRQAVRDRLSREERSAELRLRELAGPGGVPRYSYPVSFALRGADERAVREFGEELAARLSRAGKLTDIAAGPKAAPRLLVDIDRKRAAELGVSLGDINQTLAVYFGSPEADDDHPIGRTVRVRVALDSRTRDALDGVTKLQVRGAAGAMVPLSSVMALREVVGPPRVDRVDLRPAALFDGNPAPGVSLAEARWLVETLAEQVRKEQRLSAEYGLVWLQPVPAPEPMPGEPKFAPEAPPVVTVAAPVGREVTDHEEFTGRVEAAESVDLRARVSGYLEKVAFKEGTDVKKGDVLFVIDARPYQAAFDEAQGNLKAAEALRDLAKRNLERLRANAAAPKADLDAADDNYRAAAAKADAVKAAFEIAKLNLDWTTVRAPIAGRIGNSLVDPGNLVRGDETSLAHLVSVDPVYVYFDADERTVLRLERLAGDGKGKPLAEAGVSAAVGLADDNGFPHSGSVNFVDNRVNPDTGTLKIRVVLPDPKHALRPGLFARVRLVVGAPHKALLVPEEAIGSDQDRKFVYVVDKDNKVESRSVTVGARHDGLHVVSEGLQPDDRVITQGLHRVRAGQTVKPVFPKEPSPAAP